MGALCYAEVVLSKVLAYTYNSEKFFKNLNEKHWILMDFHTENGDILH